MYDIKIHIPQQMEIMLLARKQGKIEMFKDAITTIKVILRDNGFIQDLNDYEKECDKKVIDAINKADGKRTEMALNDKTYDQVLNYLEEIETPRDKTINDLLLEYMRVVEEYILGYLPQVNVEGDE